VTLEIILVFTLTRPKAFKLASRKCKNIYIYTLQQNKCKCNKFGHVSVNLAFTHRIYNFNTYMHNTGLYNEDTKIWQLSDKIMQVVGGRC